ncbi:hypothetical protein [Thalassoporum mexicanum]|uniref:hypothetical protein n=1 Tax=Thalassoporum mexicanum TaxID=3457544 RepID=UPI00059FD643|nr:hypothetical protein [Pseudanabaena sp. PCC 7367]
MSINSPITDSPITDRFKQANILISTIGKPKSGFNDVFSKVKKQAVAVDQILCGNLVPLDNLIWGLFV